MSDSQDVVVKLLLLRFQERSWMHIFLACTVFWLLGTEYKKARIIYFFSLSLQISSIVKFVFYFFWSKAPLVRIWQELVALPHTAVYIRAKKQLIPACARSPCYSPSCSLRVSAWLCKGLKGYVDGCTKLNCSLEI